MPQLSDESVQVLNGKIVLFRRKRSPLWQARFRIGRKWIRTSTKKEKLKEAQGIAIEAYHEAKFKEKHDLPVTSRKFRSVAEAVKANLQKAIDAGEGKAVFRDYVQCIDNYLIDFFGNHNVETIDYRLLQQFSKWRENGMGRVPAKSTINTHTAALNRVFEEAVSQGYMKQSQVPHMKNGGNGKASERRPDFSIDEYRQLYRYMRKWVRQEGKGVEMRYLLRDAVLFLANSGVRYGTEFYDLKWKHISYRDGTLLMHVSGKTGPREAIPRANCIRFLRRIQLRANDLKDMTFEQAIKQDKHVFRTASGVRSINLHQTFRKLMKDSGLMKCPKTGQNRTLYSLRHLYISQALINGRTDIHTLARQCGTSEMMISKHYSHLTVWDKRDELLK